MYQYPETRYHMSKEHQQGLRREAAEERLARQIQQPTSGSLRGLDERWCARWHRSRMPAPRTEGAPREP